MTLPAPATASTPSPEDFLTHLRNNATRQETPCGSGSLVWHVWGTANAEHVPVVLLHGGSGSWTHWACNIAALVQAGRQVLVPDLPGFGDSARPSTGRDADALVAPLEAGLQILLDTQGPQVCDLVGFSFGGMTAGLWTAAFPARVRRLVIAGAPGLGVVARNTVPLNAWRHLTDPAAVEAVHRHNLAALMLLHPASITPLALHIHSTNVLRDRMPGRRLAYTDALAQALGRIPHPVWAIYGREDALYQGQLDALATALAAAPAFQGLTLVEGAGHWVQFECAEAFDAVLAGILQGD